MRKTALIITLLAIFFLSIVWISAEKGQDLLYNLSVEVSNVTMLSPTPDLNFGTLRKGESATKSITLTNPFLSFLSINATFDGVPEEWADVNRDFFIGPFMSKKFYITISIPEDSSVGIYKGNVLIKARRKLII